MTDLGANLHLLRERIAAAALRAGRDPATIRLIAVTKTLSVELIRAAYDLGLRDLGENRIEEAADKVAALPSDIVWHMIGHIQSRKAKQVVQLMHFVHSVDSVPLASRMDRLSARRPERLPVLLEINISGEASKNGLSAAHWATDLEERRSLFASIGQIAALPYLRVEGLMTIAPMVSDAEEARPVFAGLRCLRDALRCQFPDSDWHHLSMGMTSDYEVAIEEGATMVRVGRAIFAAEPRPGPGTPSTSSQPMQLWPPHPR